MPTINYFSMQSFLMKGIGFPKKKQLLLNYGNNSRKALKHGVFTEYKHYHNHLSKTFPKFPLELYL